MPSLASAAAVLEEKVLAELDVAESGWDLTSPPPPRMEVLGELAKSVNEAKTLAEYYDSCFVHVPSRIATTLKCALCGANVQGSDPKEARRALNWHFEQTHLRSTLEEARARGGDSRARAQFS